MNGECGKDILMTAGCFRCDLCPTPQSPLELSIGDKLTIIGKHFTSKDLHVDFYPAKYTDASGYPSCESFAAIDSYTIFCKLKIPYSDGAFYIKVKAGDQYSKETYVTITGPPKDCHVQDKYLPCQV